ncbi:hypothetical protein SELMODRAFT_448612 [Selaginella moellendorffii]|uniref:Bifunctional inhibitor/plant lipid transfer protein/seed storage helical domain-containing protein n=1 Tax=Selaginella moellendorffii TaxID=88036 RepID=D8T8L5_SELML|nr:male-cone protein 1 [Selaginella moellendorffii]EFJ07056.1 hypothetical protein SELMODRAFT_448612 [Selaginella moellendorffii]|eukprot:XP_002991945.1 male-cone protein 1 [Selaginella moellendorffii]
MAIKFALVSFFLVAVIVLADRASGACDATNNMGKLLPCRQAAVKNGKDPKQLAGCCDAVKPFSGSKDAADCLCQSLLAAQKVDKTVDLHSAIAIPAKCGIPVQANLNCNGMAVPQH